MSYLILAVILLLLPDVYIWAVFVRGGNVAWSVLYWLPQTATFAILIVGMTGHYQEWLMKLFFILLLCVAAPKLLFAVLSLAGRGIGLFVPHAATVGNAAGAIVALTAFGMAVYGFTAGWKRLTVRERTVASSAIPAAFDGYRIVHLSDLHVGTYAPTPETVERMVRMVNDLRPDAIFFTGDLVNSDPEELDPFMETLSHLKAPDGVFSVLGNHDYCTYRSYDTPGGAARSLEEMKRRERQMGWQLLLNEHRIVRRGADSVAVVGVENDGTPPFPSLGDLPKATAGLPAGIYKILLSHDPTHWRRAVLPSTDIQLTLSGHTHAAQMRIGRFSPSAWLYREWEGMYAEGDRQLHVSAGTGGIMPFRFGAWPEIDLITLASENNR